MRSSSSWIPSPHWRLADASAMQIASAARARSCSAENAATSPCGAVVESIGPQLRDGLRADPSMDCGRAGFPASIPSRYFPFSEKA
jgi:hypothetical protein